MKKIVIILLTVLPIFLIVVISFAGRIFSEVSHINVEKVEFVDNTENPYSDKYVLQIGVGETHQLLHKVYPELATNKKVTYTSSDETICTVDQNGLVTAGNKPGTAYIVVKTDERGMTDRLIVHVVKTNIDSITILDSNDNELNNVQMSIGESIRLKYEILPLGVHPNVSWVSSDSNIVSVDESGNITAKSSGVAIITVSTEDGAFTDECVVSVDDNKPKLMFNFDKDHNFSKLGNGYKTSLKEFNIYDYLEYDELLIDLKDVKINITGDRIYTYDNSTGNIIITGSGLITITATSGISISVMLLIE